MTMQPTATPTRVLLNSTWVFVNTPIKHNSGYSVTDDLEALGIIHTIDLTQSSRYNNGLTVQFTPASGGLGIGYLAYRENDNYDSWRSLRFLAIATDF